MSDKDTIEAEPLHSLHPSKPLGTADRLLLPLWILTMAGFLLWLLTLGVNV